jgi:uncharacterized membrane protein
MGALLTNFRNTIIVSFALAGVMIYYYYSSAHPDPEIFAQAVLRWLHVLCGILWVGLLYYFNFVQIRKMPEIPADLKPAVTKYIAPEALFWFRWAALFTWVFGLGIAHVRHYLPQVATLDWIEHFQNRQYVLLGTGMWLATIMFLFVWGVIWPNQKVALGLKRKPADPARQAKAAKTAMLFSRINLLLSIPMLVTMTMSQTIFN